MTHKYTIQTSYPRNFDPEIGGGTFGPIINAYCDHLIGWALPVTRKNTVIEIETSKPIDLGDLVVHLDDEFRDWDGKKGHGIVLSTDHEEVR